jgi:protoporphyrinogen oxidase
VFARHFPATYTRKYWTREPCDLTTEWIGSRIFYPSIEDVIAGSKGNIGRATHYITKVRYPDKGGYQSFAASLIKGSDIRYNAKVSRIDLAQRRVYTATGECYAYDTLINTLPLPEFVAAAVQATPNVLEAARSLSCSELLLVNVEVQHPAQRQSHWLYVYDADKYSTRINCIEKLSSNNAPFGCSGIQVEVYGSSFRPFIKSANEIARKVVRELIEMKLVRPELLDRKSSHKNSTSEVPGVNWHTQTVPWANVIFDHRRSEGLDAVLTWLSRYGLEREIDDLMPTSDWTGRRQKVISREANVFLAGRFGQWKYFWTDDCVLRGRELAIALNERL